MAVNFQSWLDPLIILMALPAAAGGILWGVAFCLLGYFVGHAYTKVEHVSGIASDVLLGLIVVVIVLLFIRRRRRERAEARAALAPLRKKAQDAEKHLAVLAAERTRIEAKLADPALYASGRTSDITAANARLAAIAKEAAATEEAWLMAAEELEAAS